ncbi:nucleotidyl transferase AbiEii/AbiGii toxin family protein [Teredinibacter sp. KSP-S5-2]|uniref:nucleotidyl transferase AbiEii/AbiGii toxin family protein n=1 Tax=Teredinibacter sp. KSP-S5-2 TaxID=3034506 RepID=UPI00293497C1|nr:nucleotidyl transferase AbiEii/AbiGii toxin family protein [Teredinibacter sp. KSP-S5-2]WNO10870.1 nucleotidyl transferase AbiEii/AbiGii toxin family protein [Teredinibacter sp. KSP-S5-2]
MNVNPIRYAVEAILKTLSESRHYEHFVVRGSVSTRDWMGEHARPFHDLDFLYTRQNHIDGLVDIFKELLKSSSKYGLTLDINKIDTQNIWEDSISPGIRLIVPFSIKEEINELQVDIAVGDPLSQPPIEIKFDTQFFDFFPIQTVTLEIATAWKLHGLFEHLNGPWQSKTLWDLYLFCRYNSLNKTHLLEAIKLAFSSRLDPLEILKRFVYGDFGQSKQSKRNWKSDFKKFHAKEFMDLSDVLNYLQGYFMPILNLENDGTLLTLTEVIEYRVNLLREMECDEARKKLKTLSRKVRVLPYKAYRTIQHIKGSRLGPSERSIDINKQHILTIETKQPSDKVVIQEKLDGSCVCAYRQGDDILALGRDGDLAYLSPNESRRLWANWVEKNTERFLALLQPGERAVGEWLAMAHGTRYKLHHEPFVLFDIFNQENREMEYLQMKNKANAQKFVTPKLIHIGAPCSLEKALAILDEGHHGSEDAPEGLVWRLERSGKVLFKAKYVYPNKLDGSLLTETTGKPSVWNWRPE